MFGFAPQVLCWLVVPLAFPVLALGVRDPTHRRVALGLAALV